MIRNKLEGVDGGLRFTDPKGDCRNGGGDVGTGIHVPLDLTEDLSGFFDPGDRDEFSWPAQQGAALYQVARSPGPEFTAASKTA